MEKIDLQKLMFLLLFLGLTLLLLLIFSPFLSTLLWSLLFFIFVNPLYQKSLRLVPESSHWYIVYKNVLAAIFSLLVISLIVTPFLIVLQSAFRQSFQLLQLLEGFVRRSTKVLVFQGEDPLVLTVKELTFDTIDLSKLDIDRQILSILRQGADKLITLATVMAKNIVHFILTLAFMIFTIFFLLVDGKYLLGLFMRAVPINKTHLSIFIQRFKETTEHLVKGYFFVALYQAVAAAVLFYIFQVPAFLLLSLLVLFFSFIPMIGAAGIWIPVVILKLLHGEVGKAILLALLCTFFVSVVDNFLRPLILKDRIKIHPLLIFFSILGALKYFGFQGILLGPMILIFFFAALDIFLEQYN